MAQFRRRKNAPVDDYGNQLILTGDEREAMAIRANNSVLYQLGASARSRLQLTTRLKENGIPDDIIKEVLDKYEESGIINDADFSVMLAESRHRNKGLSRNAIRRELKQKGIDEDQAEIAVESISEEDEYARACDLVSRKLKSMTKLTPEVKTRRLVGLLARKGYSGNLAYKVVKEALSLEAGNALEGLDEQF